MSIPPHRYARPIAIFATLLVVATPIILAVATLAPLESAPRGGRASAVEEAPAENGTSVDSGEPGSDQQRGNRRNRRNRNQDPADSTEPGLATPAP